jgi:prevent-host-death family protein
MNASMGDARKQWAELIRAVEAGEQVILTRRGKPVAQLVAPPVQPSKVILGA